MSTRLNAKEMAAKRYGIINNDESPFGGQMMSWEANKANGYAAAILEVAQPIADQRDELLECLQNAYGALRGMYAANGAVDLFERSEPAERYRAAIAKAT